MANLDIWFGQCKFPTDRSNHNCLGKFQRFYFGPVRKGRKSVNGLVYLDEYITCTCECHKRSEAK